MFFPRRVDRLINHAKPWIRFQLTLFFMVFVDNVVIHDECDRFCPSVCGFEVLQQVDKQR